MDLHYLKIFYEVAKEKSFTKAATKLYINQSAVSIQIKKFEELLNAKLFDRSSKKIRLTYAGEALYRMAEDIFNKVQRAEKEINRIIKLGKAKIIIGSTSIIGDPLLPKLMKEFSEEYPEIEYEIQIADKPTLLKILKEGSIDIALVDEEHIVDPNLDILTVEKVPYYLITADENVNINNVTEHPLISRNNVPNNLKAINFLEEKYQINFDNRIIVQGSLQIIKGMVKNKLANVILPYYAIHKEIINGEFRVIEEISEVKDGYQVIVTKDKNSLVPIIKFLNFISNYKLLK
ncbi:LysR family transcriptional regulator [Fusobacterium perfoetens]|uniref:LysR family transcriptional regulator n=1 Tax=Fusobacterium perfoetens TaxID=852 RepID=UPI00048324AB|nr:LysR family transcriptional regulator [Fusobacterium perfoetens]MCI6151808.1 LysR family transcriptional regulator [Fusobacterium perfoetens]MDY3236831.1 LysR family transcriptional regulator [Fusobacterium perfoetens]